MVVSDDFFEALNGGMKVFWGAAVVIARVIIETLYTVVVIMIAYATVPIWPIIAGIYFAHRWMHPKGN